MHTERKGVFKKLLCKRSKEKFHCKLQSVIAPKTIHIMINKLSAQSYWTRRKKPLIHTLSGNGRELG
jgi:hypothetical protein